MRAIMTGAAGLAFALGACSAEPQDPAPRSKESPAPVAQASVAAQDSGREDLRAWLIGTWSFLPNCENDFVIVYEADGSMHTDSEIGSWTIEGNVVTETVTETFEMGEEGTTPVDPPVIREVAVERIDDTRGVLTLEGQRDPILKCSAP